LFWIFKFIFTTNLFLVAAAIGKVLGAQDGENGFAVFAFLSFGSGFVLRLRRFVYHWHHIKLFIHYITGKLILFFSLLLLPNFCILFQMLHYHLTISLLSLISLLSFFVLLIPTPFIYLRFGQATGNTYSLASFFAPGWVFLIFLHQVLHLVWVFPVSFLFVGLAWEIFHHFT
jgi:hypothetical protein